MKPEKKIKGLIFYPVPTIAAGANNYFDRRDLPDVPKKYLDKASNLFFKGGNIEGFSEKVNIKLATKAIYALLSSWEPAHEAKIATVAYAMWVWTEGKLE